MDALFIIVYRFTLTAPWQEKTSGVFSDRRLAENFVEILNSQRFATYIAIVEGIPVVPA